MHRYGRFGTPTSWMTWQREKGGKFHEVPAHHTLDEYLDAYLQAAGIAGEPKAPLFRSADRRSGRLISPPMARCASRCGIPLLDDD
jgi:hypothetical protein